MHARCMFPEAPAGSIPCTGNAASPAPDSCARGSAFSPILWWLTASARHMLWYVTFWLSCSLQVELDAAGAGDASQLVFAAEPDSEQVVVGALAPAAASPDSSQLLAPGTAVQLQGRASGVSQRHVDTNGSSLVNITLTGLPANYSDAAVACAFLPQDRVQPLEAESLQVGTLRDASQLALGGRHASMLEVQLLYIIIRVGVKTTWHVRRQRKKSLRGTSTKESGQ